MGILKKDLRKDFGDGVKASLKAIDLNYEDIIKEKKYLIVPFLNDIRQYLSMAETRVSEMVEVLEDILKNTACEDRDTLEGIKFFIEQNKDLNKDLNMKRKTKKTINSTFKDVDKIVIKGLKTEYAGKIVKSFPKYIQEKIKAGELDVEIDIELSKNKEH